MEILLRILYNMWYFFKKNDLLIVELIVLQIYRILYSNLKN